MRKEYGQIAPNKIQECIYDACYDVSHERMWAPFSKHRNFKSQWPEANSHELHPQKEISVCQL